jgi:D-alanyl-D-alanine endopeptidase (penicillin-binding protein 7)
MKTLIRVALLAATCATQGAIASPLPKLNSAHAVVFDATNQEILLDKDGRTQVPMASITKVLTAMVALDAKPNMGETIQVSGQDVDTVKRSSSRVAVGTEMTRKDALHLALMSSENRAASALSRNYPGGHAAFIRAMNEKARKLGMNSTYVEDSTGLSPVNRSTAQDLVRMVLAAERYAPITQFTTDDAHTLPVGNRILNYKNSNPLVGKPNWNIELSKTGYTQEAGRCIVMKLAAAGKDLVVVLLGSQSSGARLADIHTIKRWVSGESAQVASVAPRRYVRSKEVRHAALNPTKADLRKARLDTKRSGKLLALQKSRPSARAGNVLKGKSVMKASLVSKARGPKVVPVKRGRATPRPVAKMVAVTKRAATAPGRKQRQR